MLDYLHFLLELDSFSLNEVVAAAANYQAQKEPRKKYHETQNKTKIGSWWVGLQANGDGQ